MLTIETVKRVFRYWKSAAFKARDRRQTLDQTLNDRDEALVMDCFETWMAKFRETRLRSTVSLSGRNPELTIQEEEVLLRQEDAIMFYAWDKWVANAKVRHFASELAWKLIQQILPAVQFDNTRTKQLAWTRWKRAFELASRAKAAKKAKDRELLGRCSSRILGVALIG